MTQAVQLVIVGAGGLGREVFRYAVDAFAAGRRGRVAGFADDDACALDGRGLPVRILGSIDAVPIGPDSAFVVAVGEPAIRRRLAEKITARGGRLTSLVHPSAYVAVDARLGDGCVICPFAMVSTAAVVGSNTVVNIYASVGHDATVGDHTVLSPYATINGAAALDGEVFLGTHSTVTPGRRLGRGAKLSAGSVASRDVPAYALAIGNPAKSRVLYPAPGGSL